MIVESAVANVEFSLMNCDLFFQLVSVCNGT